MKKEIDYSSRKETKRQLLLHPNLLSSNVPPMISLSSPGCLSAHLSLSLIRNVSLCLSLHAPLFLSTSFCVTVSRSLSLTDYVTVSESNHVHDSSHLQT